MNSTKQITPPLFVLFAWPSLSIRMGCCEPLTVLPRPNVNVARVADQPQKTWSKREPSKKKRTGFECRNRGQRCEQRFVILPFFIHFGELGECGQSIPCTEAALLKDCQKSITLLSNHLSSGPTYFGITISSSFHSIPRETTRR